MPQKNDKNDILLQSESRTFKKNGSYCTGFMFFKPNTKNIIPDEYLNKINYTCTFPINIRKNILNAGAPNVYINNIKVGRFGDSADDGAMLEPSGVTVYAGNA